MKGKIINLKPQNCRTKKGCSKTSWEDMTGRTFESDKPLKKAA